jgi:hypothetical protein
MMSRDERRMLEETRKETNDKANRGTDVVFRAVVFA